MGCVISKQHQMFTVENENQKLSVHSWILKSKIQLWIIVIVLYKMLCTINGLCQNKMKMVQNMFCFDVGRLV